MSHSVHTLADIEAIEQRPWSEQLAAHNTYQLFQLAAQRYGQKTALRFLPRIGSDARSAPDYCVSYQQLLERVTQAGNAFHQVGIEAGQAVAILLPTLPQTHYALWGAECVGIASPINPMLEVEHIASIIAASGAQVLVTLAPLPGEPLWEKALAVIALCPQLRYVFQVNMDDYVTPQERDMLQQLRALAPQPASSVVVQDFNAALAAQPATHLRCTQQASPQQICAYFHTGGTTGLPKIAQHTQLNQVFMASILQQLERQSHVILCGLPLFHVNGALVTGLAAFLGGWEVVLLTPQGFRGAGVLAHFWQLVERYRATSFSAVPTIYATLANLPLDGADISSLRHAFCGAAALPAGVAQAFEQHTGIALCEGYGLTEAACISALTPSAGPRRAGSVGLRLPHQQLAAWRVDAAGQAIAPCAPGEVGVIGVSGPNVFPGYLSAADNQSLWLQAGWLNTGDLGYLDAAGYLYLTGRAKDLIIRGGHNIDPAMIEDSLQRHPAVALVAAVAQPDLHAGELPLVYVTLKPGASVDAETLLEAARTLVPERAAVPVRVEILPQLPLTTIGKVAKAELRLRAAEYVLNQQLELHQLQGQVRMRSDAARGSVAELQLANDSDSVTALALLARFAYPIDLVPARAL